jgi:hypothetical protein
LIQIVTHAIETDATGIHISASKFESKRPAGQLRSKAAKRILVVLTATTIQLEASAEQLGSFGKLHHANIDYVGGTVTCHTVN